MGRIQKEVLEYDYNDVNNSQVKIAFYPTSLLTSNFKWEMQGKQVMSYGNMQPANLTLVVSSFNNLNAVKLNGSYSDSMLKAVLGSLEFDGCSTHLDLRLTNSSAQHVTVRSISLYVDDDIVTQADLDFQLPPESTSTRTLTLNSCSVTSNFDRNWTRASLSAANVQIGIAVKYDVNGKLHTLYKRSGENMLKAAKLPF